MGSKWGGARVTDTSTRFKSNGNASKIAMVAAMEGRGHKPHDDNEADALALLYWRLEQTSLEAANRNDWCN